MWVWPINYGRGTNTWAGAIKYGADIDTWARGDEFLNGQNLIGGALTSGNDIRHQMLWFIDSIQHMP